MTEEPLIRRGIDLDMPRPVSVSSSLPATTKSWKVHLGGLWGGFKVYGGNAAPLANPGELTIYNDGRIELSARFDPSGSGWMALVAAIGTGIFIGIVAQQTGFCAGPGWLPWYLIITLIRRRGTSVFLHDAGNIIVDTSQRRMGFLADCEGQRQWVAFEIKDNFPEALQSLKMIKQTGVTEGKIDRRIKPVTVVGIIVLVFVAIILLIALSVFFAASTSRPTQIDVR